MRDPLPFAADLRVKPEVVPFFDAATNTVAHPPAGRLRAQSGATRREPSRRYAEWLLVAAVLQWLGSVAIRLV